jgi:hypothetical protein
MAESGPGEGIRGTVGGLRVLFRISGPGRRQVGPEYQSEGTLMRRARAQLNRKFICADVRVHN